MQNYFQNKEVLKYKILSALKKSEKNFDKTRIEEIRTKFNDSRHKLFKSKINKIRKYFYEIENKKDLSASRIKEIKENLLELEMTISKTKKYYGTEYDTEYSGIRDVKNLFDLSIDEDYYKPIISKSAFNNNYIQYESKGNKDKILTISEYLDMIRPYLNDIINDHKNQGEWRIQLTMEINFISSKKDFDDIRTMHTKSDNTEIMMSSETDEIIEELFKSLRQRYLEGLEESMGGSEFIFDSVDALYYDLNKISLSRGGSYIDFPEWLKNKKATINPENNDDKCFQYVLTVALYHEQI